ncbi:tyrosine-protein phosphatase [Gordonia sp. (in: high G+C Gram-positive bacteria)]|uniref:tyrosine-protein phosphatase n=1 Tax=Gordonia sp. (in: high G+C Gram-positive bacteria) TaxID=84139 RepID=UPI00260AD1AC|nr:tyrosine-protein phosphatase [Gordonia sp. (in: high G+C Gram-positive bacteria)]
MTATPGAPSPFPSLPNFRDLGHWPAADGKTVKPGLVFRSTEFLNTTNDDRTGFEALGLQTIVDLRTDPESAQCPDPSLPGVRGLHLNILEDATGSALGANLGKVMDDPASLHAIVSEFTVDKAKAAMIETYDELINSASAQKYYREFYSTMLAGELTPTLFHCTTGKDRTGWAAASFLTLMGVPTEDVYTDYLLTNDRLLPALSPIIAKFEGMGGQADAINAVLGVEKDYLDVAFSLVEKGWGSFDGYAEKVLGLDASAIGALRERYLAGA